MARTARTRTLREMARDQSVLEVLCLRCSHRKDVHFLSLLERFGPDQPIHELRFRCAICGGSAAVRESIR